KHKGSYYLPYQAFATQSQFDKAYPNADKIRLMKSKVDPNGILHSGFAEQYLKSKSKSSREFYKNIASNAEYRKAFEKFLDNVLQRVDKDKFFVLLDDILSYADKNDDVYQELQCRICEIMPSNAQDILHVLNSLRDIKLDLGKQVTELF